MKLSACTVFKGTVVDVRKDTVAAQGQVDIGGGNLVTSTITADSANRLGLEAGKAVTVVVKASDVVLAVDE